MVVNLRDDVRRILREEKVAATGGIGVQPRGVQFRIADPDRTRQGDAEAAANFAEPAGLDRSAPVGARRRSISSTTTPARSSSASPMPASPSRIRRAVDQSIEVIRRRVDALGTTEPSIQREGNDRVSVEVPGLAGPSAAEGPPRHRRRSSSFRMVADPGANPARRRPARPDRPRRASCPWKSASWCQGEDLTDASARLRPAHAGQPVVNFKFNIRGGQRFAQATSENVGKPVRHRARRQGDFGATHQ